MLGEYLVHLRQTDEGLEYRVGGGDGEQDDIDLDFRIRDYFRLYYEIGEVYAQLGRHRAVALAIGRYPGLRLLRQEPWECLVSHLCSGASSIRGIRDRVERIAPLSRRKFRVRYDRIVSFDPYDDGFGIMRDAQTARPQTFRTADSWFPYNLAVNLAQM